MGQDKLVSPQTGSWYTRLCMMHLWQKLRQQLRLSRYLGMEWRRGSLKDLSSTSHNIARCVQWWRRQSFADRDGWDQRGNDFGHRGSFWRSQGVRLRKRGIQPWN